MPESVREDRLDQVAVADGHPHRPGAVLGLDERVAAAYGGHRPRLHRDHRLAAREGHGGRLRLDGRPELLLGQVLQGPTLPLAVVALGEAALGRRAQRVPPGRPAIALRRLPAALERARDGGDQRDDGQPLAGARGLLGARVVEPYARGPAREHAGRVRRRTAVSDQDHRCHVGDCSAARWDYRGRVIVDCALYRGGSRIEVTATRPRCAAARPKRATSSGWGCTSRRGGDRRRRRGLRPAPAGGGGRGDGAPAAQAGALRHTLFLVLKTLWYVDEQDAVETGEIALFIGHDFVVSVRHGQGNELHSARTDLEAGHKALTHGPGGVVYAVMDRVVDEYIGVVEELHHRRRRDRDVGLLRPAHQRLRPDLRAEARDRRGTPRRAAPARAAQPVRRRKRARRHARRPRRSSATSPTTWRAPRRRSTRSTRCCRRRSTPTSRRSRCSRTTTCARSPPGPR